MKLISRRDALKSAVLSAVSTQLFGESAPASGESPANPSVKPALGVEGQRRADLGDGTYLNPIVAGDHPDPTVLKDGDDYYMTFSSMFSYPGVILWHSRDLVNWAPIGPALTKPMGTVWAMDLVKHEGRYFIYIPIFNADAPEFRGAGIPCKILLISGRPRILADALMCVLPRP